MVKKKTTKKIKKKIPKTKTAKIKKKVAKSKKKEEVVLSWTFPLLIFVILVFSFTSFLLFLFFKNYKDWEEEFLISDAIFLDYRNESLELEEKILEYNRSQGEYAFIEFTKEESLFLFSNSLDESLPDWVEVKETALIVARGDWMFYVKSKVWNLPLPWLGIYIVKDDLQSVEIYIEDIFLGEYSFRSFSLDSVVERANLGLYRAIRLINDGNFAGRVFENIELGEENLVIKSRNISP